MLSLKVEIGTTGKVSAMIFNMDMSVAEAIKQIEAKFGTNENYSEYGLLRAASVGEPARWLKEDKTLANQNLNNLDLVVWKSKIIPIKIFLIDGTTKTVRIDDSFLVGDICDKVCDMLQIERTAYIEYGLQVMSKNLKYPKWLNREISLQEQITEGEQLTFKKKFFVSDANIDKSNEMQLHLIYTQAKQSILTGEYPCEKHQAVEFAAVQLQAEIGNCDKKKHTPEWFDEAKYLPPSYAKLKKKLWKEIESVWEKHVGMTTQNAKQRYVQRCRELPTYGITTFEVKEKDPEKKKLQPILFGITRRTIMRMDGETKEIIKQYPLVSVKRYSHSPNSFTIDFGTHSNSGYYIVQTVRGAEIKELLDGYIDILFGIMKRGQDKDLDEGKNIANLEDVESYFAVAQVSTFSKTGIGKYSSDDFRETEFFHGRQEMEMGSTENAKRNIDSDMSIFSQQAMSLAGEIGGLKPSTANMPGEFKEDLLSAASNLGRAMSDLLGGLGNDSNELTNDKARKILANLKQLITASRNASGETEDMHLIEAGKRIAKAIGDILQCTKELMDDPNNPVARLNLKKAINALRSAAGYLQGAVNGVLADPISEQLLLESSKQVFDAISRLVNGVGRNVDNLQDPNLKHIMEMQMDNTRRTGANLLDVTGMLAPIIIDPLAKQQLLDTAKNSKSDCDKLLRLCGKMNLPQNELNRLLQVAKQVSDSLMQLAQATECASSKTAQDQEQMNNVARSILDGINNLKRTQGDVPLMSQGIKNIAKLIPEFLHVVKSCAVNDPSRKNELLEAAKKLAEASRLMLMSGKLAISEPKDQNAFKKLLLASRQVGDLIRECLGDKNKLSIFTEVRSKAKDVAACLTGFANTTRGAIQDGNDQQTRRKLYDSSEIATKSIQKLLDALQYATSEPDNLVAQSKLVSVCKELAKPLAQAINSTRYCIPKIDDIISKKAVKFSSDESGKALSKLVQICGFAGEITGDKDVDQAIEEFGIIGKDLDSSLMDSEIGALHQTQSREESENKLKSSLLEVTRAIANLRHAHEVGLNSKKLAYAFSDVAQSSIAIASNTSGTDNQKSILNATKDMIPDLLDLIRKAKGSSLNNDEDDPSLLDAAKKLQERIKDLLATTQKGTGAEECQNAAIQVQKALSQLVLSPSYNPGDIVNLSADVEQKSRAVAIATGKMVQIALDKNSTPEQIKQAAISIASVMPTLINSVNRMTVACKNKNAQSEIIRTMQILGGHTVRVLENASTSRIDDKSAETLQQEHKYVLESVQKLLQALTEATPGIQELEKASKMLKDSQRMQDEIPEGHFGLHELSLATERLGDSAVKMIQSVTIEPEKLGTHSITSARCIAEIINMVRSYSPLSESLSYAIAIEECVKEMESDPSTIVENTKSIAKNVQNLNKAMQGVINQVDQPTKLKIKEISQQIAPDLKELIQNAQNLKNTNDPKAVINSGKKLSLNVNKLAQLPNGSDLFSDLLRTARDLANATSGMVGNATNIAKNPGDKQSIQDLTENARELGETMKKFKQQTKKLAPGSTNCEVGLIEIQKSVNELGNGCMSSAVGVLEVIPEMTHQHAQEEMVKIAKKLFTCVQGIVENVKEDQWENVGLSVLSLSQHVTESSKVAHQVAGTTTNQDTQVEHLELVKDIADESFELANLCTDLTINNSNKKLKQNLLNCANNMRDKIQRLVDSLKGGVVGLRACDEAMGLIEDSLKEFETPPEKTDKKYAQCQTELIDYAQQCALNITQLFHTAKSEPDSVGNPSKSLAISIGLMIKASKIASSATDEKQNKEDLIVNAKLLANSAKKIINSSKTVAVDKGQNPLYVEQLSRSFQEVTERVTSLIRSVREGATGEKQCKEAIASIKKNVASIETAVMVCTTGEYYVNSRIPLDSCQSELDDTIKEIVNCSKQLNTSIKGTQTELGRAAKDLSIVISKFTENSKLLSGILSDVSSQSDILTSSKLVGQRAQQLVLAAMNAQGNKGDNVNEKFKLLVEAIQEVRNTVKGSIGSQIEGVVLLNTTQKNISDKVKQISQTAGNQKSDPEKIIEPIRSIHRVCGELFQSQGTSIGEIQSICEELSKSFALNIQTTQASLGNVQTEKGKQGIITTVGETGEALQKFLDLCKVQRRDDDEFDKDFSNTHENLENAIKNQIEATRNIPGCEDIELEKNLADELSNEMMIAAQQILNAANELLKAPPKGQIGLEENDLSGQILEIAREVTQHAYELLQASINAQNEIQQKGQAGNKESAYRKDPQWAKGLISAAQQVSQTIQDLVQAANSVVKGDTGSGVELIVATSRCVNSSTARLVSASKVKLDLFSPNQQKLSNCASNVTKATKTLGEVAKTSVEVKMIQESNSGNLEIPKNALLLNKARLEQQERVNKTQKDLDKAYRELKQFRRDFYKESEVPVQQFLKVEKNVNTKEVPTKGVTKVVTKGSVGIPLKGGRGTITTNIVSTVTKEGGRGRSTGIPIVKTTGVVKTPSSPKIPLKEGGGRGIVVKKVVGRSTPIKNEGN